MTRAVKPMVVILALLLAGTTSSQAQTQSQPCVTYFLMYQFDSELGLIPIPALTTDQAKWLQKKAKKKYPGFCLDAERATYVLVTFRWTEERQRTVTRTKSASTTGPVPIVVGVTASGPGRPGQPIWGTEVETFVTTWQEEETQVVHEPHALIFAFETKDGQPLSATSELRSALAPVRGVGRTATKHALEQAFEFLTLKRKARADEDK